MWRHSGRSLQRIELRIIVLPILIVPDAYPDEYGCMAVRQKPRIARRINSTEQLRTRWRVRCQLARRVVISLGPVVEGEGNFAETASLKDCERVLQLLLRRKKDSLLLIAKHQIHQLLTTQVQGRVSSTALSVDAATWLVWTMSWRGVSIPKQIGTPPLHPPTLLIRWWSSMPASLRFGSPSKLMRALCDCAERSYRLWLSIMKRMRAFRAYFLDPRLVDICFTAQSNSGGGKLTTIDNIMTAPARKINHLQARLRRKKLVPALD